MAANYMSIFSDGTNEYVVRDDETRALIPVSASVSTCESIISELT